MILGAWTGVFTGEAVGRWYVNLITGVWGEDITDGENDRRARGDRRERARGRGLARSQAAAGRVRRGAAGARVREGLRGDRPGRRCRRAASAVDRCPLQEQGRRARASQAAASSFASTRHRRCGPICFATRCPTRCRICFRCRRARPSSTSIRCQQHDDQVSGLLVAAVTENVEQIIATLSRVKLKAQAVDLSCFRARARHGARSPTPTRRSRPSASATTRRRSWSRAAASRSSCGCCRSTSPPRPRSDTPRPTSSPMLRRSSTPPR